MLGLDPEQSAEPAKLPNHGKPKLDWEVLSGVRFFLSLMVMFMHLGSDESWGAFANLRQFPFHVHLFFTLGGYVLAASMAPPIKKKTSFVVARFGGMYPLYAVALVLSIVNLLVTPRSQIFNSLKYLLLVIVLTTLVLTEARSR